jgi:hypothetical protein
MKKALIAIASCSLAQPALAQWGLFGFAADGRMYEINEFTGEMALVGDVGVPVVDAASINFQEIVVLTDDDRVLSVNLRNLETTVVMQLTGRPAGYVPVAFGGYAAVLRPPVGHDILYAIDTNATAYLEIRSTGINDVTGMDETRLCTTSGDLYYFNSFSGQRRLVWRLTNGDPLETYAITNCGDVVTGDGMYLIERSTLRPIQIRATGFAHIKALAYSSAMDYACEFSVSGPGGCDIFDFLDFQNAFVNGDPLACDCDTSTGPGVCDLFDFLCFQNAWAEVGRVASGCR